MKERVEKYLEQLDGSEVAVIGMACRFPGANDLETFWRNLCDGVESVTFLKDEDIEPSTIDPDEAQHPNYVNAAALLDDVDLFDAAFFGYTPREAEVMDPQHRLLLECAWQAIEHAGYNTETYNKAVGVFAGARTNTYLFNLISNPELVRSLGAFEIGLGNDLSFLTSRIAYKLNLRGPGYSVHTACSTSLAAIHLACQSLLLGECQMALAGGVAVNVPQKAGYLYQPGGIVSPDGHCRTFDAEARGTLFGSGVGLVVLKRLEEALLDGDQIYAVIRGTAVNNDGALKASFTAPGVYGQEEVILEALANAGVDADSISYIETHGTGTALGDPIEIRALSKAFETFTNETGFCALGAVKTNFGHLDAAAGIAGFIKTVLALQHKQLPPTLHFAEPNPNINFAATPFYVNDQLTSWDTERLPRRAGVSSFGIGGTNAHIILEEAPVITEVRPSRSWQMLPLSARTETALDAATTNLIHHLRHQPDLNLADAAYTLQVGRKPLKQRRFVVCRTAAEGADALETLQQTRVVTGYSEISDRSVAFLFPGQGTQYEQMGRELYENEPVFRQVVDQCAGLLKPYLGLDLRHVLYPEPGNAAAPSLDQTAFTQPALFVIEYALAQLWQSWGVRPQAMLGHSIGEYVAACLAGVFSLPDVLALVAARGRLMQALPGGAMLAVALREELLRPLLNDALAIAAINEPQQCVVSGPYETVDALEQRLAAQGIDYRRLQTSHAFHSSMMEPMLEAFAAQLQQVRLNEPQIPYLSNVTGTWITAAQATDPAYWLHHLRHTVYFGAGVKTLLTETHHVLLEVGPGQALSRLVRRHPAHTAAHPVFPCLPSANQGSEQAVVLIALGQLWLADVKLDWATFYATEWRQRCPLPTYPFEKQRFWVASQPPMQGSGRTKPLLRSGKSNQVTDWFYTPSWKRTPALPSPTFDAQPEARWLLFGDDSAVSQQLEQMLHEAGQVVTLVTAGKTFAPVADSRYTINPHQASDYQVLVQKLHETGHLPDTVLHLWNMAPVLPGNAHETFAKAQWRGYYSLLFLAQALAQAHVVTPLQLWVISANLHQVESQDVIHPEKATLLGPCKVIPQEYAHLTCHSLDVTGDAAAATEVVRQILAEAVAKTGDVAIAYRGRRRWVQTFEPITWSDSFQNSPTLRQNGVYLMTGGLGGVGHILATYLAQTVQARLVLTGRTALPPRDTWAEWCANHDEQDPVRQKIARVQALEALGAEVMVAGVDIADEAGMQALINAVEARFGALHGVLHAAGVTSGSSVFTPLSDIGIAESETQFGPKGYGLYVLEKVLQGKPLDFCLLFSSNAAILGGLGFVAYAAANAFMDAFAIDRRHHKQLPWLSANWDHWPEETRQFTGFQTSMDQYTMTRAESEQAFRLVTAMRDEGHVVVSTGDLSSRLRIWIERNTEQESSFSSNGAAAHPRPALAKVYVAPRNEDEATIATIWQQILGLERVGVDDNFFELGGHSLLATRLVARLRDVFQMELPLAKFFETPTVAGIAAAIQETRAAVEDEDKMEILRMLAELSDEEAEVMLQQQFGYEST